MTCNYKVKLGSNEDRISSLPDGVICHILSFIPTKYSVRTSVLSTRWKHLFTFVPNLDFIYETTYTDSPAASSTVISFIHFVSSVFIIYNVYRMNKFRLDFYHFGHPPTHYPIFSWISSAIIRQVQEIDITINLVVPRTLPLDLFTCESLTYLRLWGKFNVVLPQTACLPFLRICHLGRVCFNEKSAQRLFRSCPVVEQLSLISCDMGEGVEVLNISAPALKRFYIHVRDDRFQIVFNVPKLTSLEYVAEGPVKNEFSGLESFKSMGEAVISYEQESNIEDGVSVELVRGICHVSQLCLYCCPIEAFQRSGHSLPTFNNLTRLTLGPMSNLSSKLLSNLLDNSPHLEFLSFNQRYADELDGADQNKYVLPGHVSACVSLHLKEVEFRHFNMLEYECKLIRYFLKSAKNLEKMHIRSTLSWDVKFEISSAACQIVFDSDGIEE